MKVMITAAQFSSSISGLQRHALTLVRCLLQQSEIEEIHFVYAPWQEHMVQSAGLHTINRVTLHMAAMNRGVASRNLWYYRLLPRLVEQVQPDIVHLAYPVPVNAAAIRQPIVLSLHDLYPYDIPENFGFPKVLFNRAILQQCLRSVDAIACVSDATLSRMKQHTPHTIRDKALRVFNCVERTEECSDQSPIPNWQNEPFLLTVSQHRKNKNIALLLQSFHELLQQRKLHADTKLVVVGISGPETESIHQLTAKLALEEKVIFLEGISEASLQWCYRNCELLAAPSSIEGFGLPVAEALMAGSRVVCSNIPAFREIDEAHCSFVQLGPRAAENLAQAIADSLNHPRPSPQPLPQFSPSVLGEQYINLYQRLSSTAGVLEEVRR